MRSDVKRAWLADIFTHHLLVVGQTGSGKTTTTLSLLNQLQALNQTTIVLDPTGEYAQLPNAITYQLGVNAYLEAGTLSADELQEVLQLHLPAQIRNKLVQAITALRVQHNIIERDGVYKKCGQEIDSYQQKLAQLAPWAMDYQAQDLFKQLIEEFIIPYDNENANYRLLGQQYDRKAIARNWDILTTIRERLASEMFATIFDTRRHPGKFKTELSFVFNMFLNQRSTHRTLVIDLSALKGYEESQRVLISFLMKKILQMRLQRPKNIPVNVVLDEAHRYLPQREEKLADNGIFQVLREGRKLHLKVLLTTQSPLDLPPRLRSQFNNIVIHRLMENDEIKSLGIITSPVEIKKLGVGKAGLKIGDQLTKVQVAMPNWWK
ncbi:ATP-binding protein [Limosilactobacillus sp. STM2_1]|uniref:ATP-binding protein n=1 Tax=Limosilactobacillus rudii TaxID=2759755 RepID=A0A7W3UNE0_9LACO|nr:ATP-binding protein [Limosilactobacillus rudii]MBB1098150.1 ATP-binding protein [Limosilactobacillus rudii]